MSKNIDLNLKDKISMKIIVVFSTGRSGTALLAQYFGGLFKNKNEWKRRKNFAIAHEPFDESNEYKGAVTAVKNGGKTGIAEFIIKELRKFVSCDNFFITDNKLGRWFLDDLHRAGIETKIIYLYRNDKKTARSLKRSCSKRGTGWCFESSDANNITDTKLDPYRFHIEETKARWLRARKKLKSEQYIEVSFERFLKDRESRKKLEIFVGISGYEDLLTEKVNISLPFFGWIGYTRPRDIYRLLLPKGVTGALKKIINGYYLLRIKLRKKPFKILFILSHMRSGSTLLQHILASNPQIIGYGEGQIRYNSKEDLDALICKNYMFFRKLRMPEEYVLDKIPHRGYVKESLLKSQDIYAIFLLRGPEATLKSLLGLLLQWDLEESLNYYMNRLSAMENEAKAINDKKRSLYITYEQLLHQTDRVFKVIQESLNLQHLILQRR